MYLVDGRCLFYGLCEELMKSIEPDYLTVSQLQETDAKVSCGFHVLCEVKQTSVAGC